MACGGFTCSKNALAALNVLYILVACILIGMAAYGKAAALIATIEIMGGIIACGVFLLLIAIVGLIGAMQHHQVLLFFYMIVLFLLFLVQFAVACALLALDQTQQLTIARWGWNHSHDSLLNTTQITLKCCDFEHNLEKPLRHPKCELPLCRESEPASDAACCLAYSGYPFPLNTTASNVTCPYSSCWDSIGPHMNGVVKTVGGISLFFSFTEMVGVFLALRFRNLKDPRANPSAFL